MSNDVITVVMLDALGDPLRRWLGSQGFGMDTLPDGVAGTYVVVPTDELMSRFDEHGRRHDPGCADDTAVPVDDDARIFRQRWYVHDADALGVYVVNNWPPDDDDDHEGHGPRGDEFNVGIFADRFLADYVAKLHNDMRRYQLIGDDSAGGNER